MGFFDSLTMGLLSQKPKVPPFRPVSAQQEQRTSITGNIAALPDLQNLASQVNAFSSDELLKQLNKLMPGYDQLLKSSTSKMQSELRGEVPEDVQRNIRQFTAETAGAGGYSGSSFAGDVTAKRLGITSLDISNRALDSASRWIAQADALARGLTMDFTPLFITPAQQIAHDVSERDKQFQRDWRKNQFDAAYDPMTILGQSLGSSGGVSQALNWFGGTQVGGAINAFLGGY